MSVDNLAQFALTIAEIDGCVDPVRPCSSPHRTWNALGSAIVAVLILSLHALDKQKQLRYTSHVALIHVA